MARAIFLVLFGFQLTVRCWGANYDEASDGDVSGDRFSPTPIALGLGSNLISLSVGDPDDDYFTIQLPPNAKLTSIHLRAYGHAGNTTFLGIHRKPFYDPTPNLQTYGYVVFGQAQLDEDLLPAMGASNGRFAPPLDRDEYTFRLDEIHLVETCTFEFLVTRAECSSDLDGNGEIDLADLSLLLANFGAPHSLPSEGDLDGDTHIDLEDLSLLLAVFGGWCS